MEAVCSFETSFDFQLLYHAVFGLESLEYDRWDPLRRTSDTL
jgi:hypothetical protein